MMRVLALASPLIWFASQGIQFALAPLTCPWHSNAILWMVAGAALLLELASGWAAWIEWKRQPVADGVPLMPPWLCISAIALSVSFAFVIVAQSIPSLMLGGCS